jgi:hypothetical protein
MASVCIHPPIVQKDEVNLSVPVQSITQWIGLGVVLVQDAQVQLIRPPVAVSPVPSSLSFVRDPCMTGHLPARPDSLFYGVM